jgi:DNA polymerase sigma
VDVSLNKDDGMLAVPLVKRHLDTMPALRSLLMLLKRFLAQRELNSAATAGVSGYVLTCMCISFLQVRRFCLARRCAQGLTRFISSIRTRYQPNM